MSINVSVAGLQGRVRCGGAAVYAKHTHTRPTRMPGPAVWPGWRDREGGETRDLGSKRVLGSTLRYYYRYYRSFDAREGKLAATAREEACARWLARAIHLPSAAKLLPPPAPRAGCAGEQASRRGCGQHLIRPATAGATDDTLAAVWLSVALAAKAIARFAGRELTRAALGRSPTECGPHARGVRVSSRL